MSGGSRGIVGRIWEKVCDLFTNSEAVKDQVDKFEFVDGKLRTTGEDGGGSGSEIQEVIDELIELNSKVSLDDTLDLVATEATQELIRQLLILLNAKDYATETTQVGIKSQTDKLTFVGDELKVISSGGSGGESVFGDTGGYNSLLPDGTNQLVLAASTTFKEVILYHENKRKAWIKLGGGAAVVGEGFPISKEQPWILDRCRDEIRIIFESGFDTKELQINTVNV